MGAEVNLDNSKVLFYQILANNLENVKFLLNNGSSPKHFM